jgi:hypothetical protein
MEIRIISRATAKEFIERNHYARTTPSTVKFCLGWFDGERLMGVGLWGYGVRPAHTIARMFPSLATANYLELNRLCLLDELPRNSETQFLSACVAEIRRLFPDVKLLFSWADGLRGKPGYVYQAASWLYGGFIKSEFYAARDGEVLHPRLLITRYGTRSVWKTLGLRRVFGYQFRYCKFLCSHGERKRLLAESPFDWTTKYPKQADLRFWLQKAGEVSREIRQLPKLKGMGQFHPPAPKLTQSAVNP